MGIEDFSTFLKKYAPNCYYEIPLSSFSGKRIALDINNVLYIFTAVSAKIVVSQTNLAETEPDPNEINKLVLDRLLDRLAIFLYHNISPICCFDSQPNPLKGTSKKKMKKKEQTEKDLQEFYRAKNALYNTEPLYRNTNLTKQYEKAYLKIVRPSWEFTAYVGNLLSNLGFCVLYAKDYFTQTGDAEALTASLCISGNDYCIAGNTTDSDFHVYGGNLAITDFTTRYNMVNGVNTPITYVTVRSLEAILIQTGMTFTTFRDFCIMLGTDYNVRIPRIGPVNAFDLIQKHKTVAQVSNYQDVQILNYNNVIVIFNETLKHLNVPNPDFNPDTFRKNCRNVLEIENLTKYIKIILDLPICGGKTEYTPQIISSSEFDSLQVL